MNNREYLNTLSDEEFVEWCMKYFFSQTHLEIYSTESLTEKVKEMALKMLQAEHTTSADEDFTEIGFEKDGETRNGCMQYRDKNYRAINIFNNKPNVFWTGAYMMGTRGWTKELIDKIQIIADKKRKEMGWDK